MARHFEKRSEMPGLRRRRRDLWSEPILHQACLPPWKTKQNVHMKSNISTKHDPKCINIRPLNIINTQCLKLFHTMSEISWELEYWIGILSRFCVAHAGSANEFRMQAAYDGMLVGWYHHTKYLQEVQWTIWKWNTNIKGKGAAWGRLTSPCY